MKQVYLGMIAGWAAVGLLLGLWRGRRERVRGAATGAVIGGLLGAALATLMVIGSHRGEPVATGEAISDTYLAIDHVNVAVKDLEAAAQAYEAMGFTIKPGRVHENSIDNRHIKFADDTELELITATQGRDRLSHEYVSMVEKGDGGAFLALRTTDYGAVTRQWEHRGQPLSYGMSEGARSATIQPGHPLHAIWLLEKKKHIADEAKFTEHPNTATRLTAVWFSPDVADDLRRLFSPAGGTAARRIALDEGDLILTDLHAPVADRPIVGVTIEVRDIEAAAGRLRAGDIPFERSVAGEKTTLRVGPRFAHGIWVEFTAR